MSLTLGKAGTYEVSISVQCPWKIQLKYMAGHTGERIPSQVLPILIWRRALCGIESCK